MPADTRTYDAKLVGCYDGDTCTFDVQLTCDAGGNCGLGIQAPVGVRTMTRTRQHVRLCDINAPELHPGPNPKAIRARDDLVRWMRGAKNVQLAVPQRNGADSYEKYGRLLAYVLADGAVLNQRQLKVGNARPFIQCK